MWPSARAFLINGAGDIVAQKKAEAAANKLKSHEHDANAALAHGTSYSVHGVRNAKQNGGRSEAEHTTMLYLRARFRMFMLVGKPVRRPV